MTCKGILASFPLFDVLLELQNGSAELVLDPWSIPLKVQNWHVIES